FCPVASEDALAATGFFFRPSAAGAFHFSSECSPQTVTSPMAKNAMQIVSDFRSKRDTILKQKLKIRMMMSCDAKCNEMCSLAYQAPTSRNRGAEESANKNVVIQIPDRGLAGDCILEHIIWFSVHVKIGGAD